MENYIVSARKYRPDTFESVVAQKSLTTTLKNAIHSGKLAHAYLFCGPRGVGKTTCARIFAKTINCEHLTADGEPCNECESCRSFNQQRSYSIYELDAASNNSVEDIRSLNEQVRIPPQVGRYKVYIIDEVHMLSQAAFNAFLKTLEEPPAHAIFILATTEKHKIIPTILSRCQIYDFSRIEVADIVSHLQNIATKEGINTEYEALRIIAQKSDGCMRDALSLFDQMVSFTQGDLTYIKVIESLNVLDYEYYFRFTDYLLAGQTSQALLLFNDVLNKGFEGSIFVEGAASHFRDLLVNSDPVTLPLFEGSDELRNRYATQAQKCTAKFLFRAIKLCSDCSMNYRASRNKRLLVELTIIQLSQLVAGDDSDVSGGRSPKLKPLFNKSLSNDSVQTVKTAPASNNPVITSQVQQQLVVAPEQNAPANTTKPTVPHGRPQSLRPTMPTGTSPSLGHMFGGVRSMLNTKQNTTTTLETDKAQIENGATNTQPVAEHKVNVTNENLVQAWTSFALQLPDNERALSDRMKIMTPHLLDDDRFEISVDNQLAAEMFEREMPRILRGIATFLPGNALKASIKVNEIVVERHVYDRKKQYEILREKNHLVEKLRQRLNLELS
ncbi:MAG: DNA polymerase III subunit gamma/tau [Bacteroidaceae bacterium]|nr:DNA polymerase III subunit gamma/tau [Bacteroidaceae bacterium]